MNVPLARPWFSDDALELVGEALSSGWVTQGPFVARFEGLVAQRLGLPHGIACTSATTALTMAMHDAGLDVMSERVRGAAEPPLVAVPSFTFPSPVNVILHSGCRPVFVDVDPRTYNMDPEDLAAVLEAHDVAAVVAVHQFGLAADMDPIAELCAEHGAVLFEDGACALGSTRHGTPIGHHGAFVALSFHPRKIVTTGEGGMLLTRDGDAAARLRVYRSQGVSISDMSRHAAGRTFTMPGFAEAGLNFRLSDIQGAVGVSQMGLLDEILRRRRDIGHRYVALLDALPHVSPPLEPDGYEHTFQTFCATVDADAPFTRGALVEALRAGGLGSTPGAVCAHKERAYADHPSRPLPNTESLEAQAFLLPLYPQMSDDEVAHVLATVERCVTELSGAAA